MAWNMGHGLQLISDKFEFNESIAPTMGMSYGGKIVLLPEPKPGSRIRTPKMKWQSPASPCQYVSGRSDPLPAPSTYSRTTGEANQVYEHQRCYRVPQPSLQSLTESQHKHLGRIKTVLSRTERDITKFTYPTAS
jgi:hypothetical protein